MIDALLVTGLPAAGRSTLLLQLLRDPDLADARCVVCVHRHARAFGLETTVLPVDTSPCVHYAEVFDFGSGCLCCSPEGDLSRLLNELCSRQDELKLTHLLIETTGVADPTPFMKLFDDNYRGQFTLRCVLNVVDLLRLQSILDENKDTGDQSAGSRGRIQLRCSDILILNHADELSESSLEDKKRMLLSAAAEEASSAPEILGPCSFCGLGKTLMSSIAAVGRSERRVAPICEALPRSMFQLRFGPGVHDAACSTCCLVRRGVASLEAVLAMLQLLLDSGEAYRIQGYLSFLPQDLEPGHRPTLGSNMFPPPLERLWAMPMVVVEGYYRGPLKLSPVQRAGAEAAASRQWQETAFDSAAADRGGCKIFLCGPHLDEAQLKAQLKQCVAPSFDLVCNLEEIVPDAAQAIDRLEKQVTGAMQSTSKEVDQDGADGAGVRPSAEAFAQLLLAELSGAGVRLETGAGLRAVPTTPHRVRARLPPQRGRSVVEAVEVHWENGVVSVTAAGSAARNGSSYETLVLGSDIYCRQSLTE